MSHIKQLQAQFTYNTKQVLWLTGLSQQGYEKFMADTAAAFADHVSALCTPQTLLECPLFLGWWFHNWHMADDRFILPALYETTNNRYAEYRVLHQYCFNPTDPNAMRLFADFRNLLPSFLTTKPKKVCK